MQRAIVIVLDSLGIGELPDAALFGDTGSNTLRNILEVTDLELPNLSDLGLGYLVNHPQLPQPAKPTGLILRLATSSPGKDTLTGHWEMMGHPQAEPFPTYPGGFSTEVIDFIEKISGRPVLGNEVASGTEIISRLGQEQVNQGGLIVYTSADSVLQIAAHEQVVPLEELYRICQLTHERLLRSDQKVARVIARPFVGESPSYRRSDNRRDFSAKPEATLLNVIVDADKEVLAVGKISDIFAGSGISKSYKTKNNRDGIDITKQLIESGCGDLIFTNLVDFDMLYGHRNDPGGYAAALSEFDRELPKLIQALHPTDLLIITADHGCDPVTPSTDHSREYVPCLVYKQGLDGCLLDDGSSLCVVAATIAHWLELPRPSCGISVLEGKI